MGCRKPSLKSLFTEQVFRIPTCLLIYQGTRNWVICKDMQRSEIFTGPRVAIDLIEKMGVSKMFHGTKRQALTRWDLKIRQRRRVALEPQMYHFDSSDWYVSLSSEFFTCIVYLPLFMVIVGKTGQANVFSGKSASVRPEHPEISQN